MIKNEVFGIVWYIFGQCSMTVHSQISIKKNDTAKKNVYRFIHVHSVQVVLVLGVVNQTPCQEATSDGSYLHPNICCRPCILFAHGACEQGANCGYCHLPHATRTQSDMVIEQIATGATPRFCNLCTPGNEISKKTNLYCRSQQKEADMIVTLILASSFAMREELQWRAFYFGEIWNIHILPYFIIC